MSRKCGHVRTQRAPEHHTVRCSSDAHTSKVLFLCRAHIPLLFAPPKHSVDLHPMLRTLFPHFEASLQQPAHSFVVLNSGVSSTFTYCFGASATSFTGTRRSPFPVGPKCANSYITTSTSCSLTDFQDDPVLSLFQSQCQIASKLCCDASQPQTEPATRSPMFPCAHQLMQPSPPC